MKSKIYFTQNVSIFHSGHKLNAFELLPADKKFCAFIYRACVFFAPPNTLSNFSLPRSAGVLNSRGVRKVLKFEADLSPSSR
jgi:ABC-type thiamine transport system substrate-binding protein